MARIHRHTLMAIVFRALVLLPVLPLMALAQEPGSTAFKAFDWVDTSSPRATLKSFLTGEKRYYDLIRSDGYTWENQQELSNILEQSERLFDLREIPLGHRRSVTHETTALIREALARVPLPDINTIPDEDEMAERLNDGKSAVYRVPDTPFEISRIDSGPDTGRYQFTQNTIEHAPAFYDEIKNYPYQPDHKAGCKGFHVLRL